MARKGYILVFSEQSVRLPAFKSARAILNVLNIGDRAYALDGNVVFISTEFGIEALTEKIRASALGQGHFFIADISEADRSGNMTPAFWDFLHSKNIMTSAA